MAPTEPNKKIASVFEQLVDDKTEAEDLTKRANLMVELVTFFKSINLSTYSVAELCKIPVDQAADLMSQKFSKFTTAELQRFRRAVPIVSSKRLLGVVATLLDGKETLERIGNHGLCEGCIGDGKGNDLLFIAGNFLDGDKERFFFDLDPADYTTPFKARWKSLIENDLRIVSRTDHAFLSPPDIFKYIPLLHEAFPDRVIDKYVIDTTTKMVSTYEGYLAPVWS